MINVLWKVTTLLFEIFSSIRIILSFSFDFFSYILLVKTNNWLFKFLVVSYVVKCIMYLVLKLFLLFFLFFQSLLKSTVLTNQSTHFHTQIFYNKYQIQEYPFKVCLLLLHFISLFLKLINSCSTRSNISLKLLNFVI